MNPTASMRSAFDEFTASDQGDGRGVAIEEISGLDHFNLRCAGEQPELAAACREALGMSLPGTHSVSRSGNLTVCWLGPDEWLIIGRDGAAAGVAERVGTALQGNFHAFTDLGGAMAALRVSGPAVDDVLRQGTPLDIHPRIFPPESCAQTVLAKTSVLLVRDDHGFDIHVRRSFADYLLRFLLDAAHDYGYRFQPA